MARRRLTKEELERLEGIRTARKGRLITPTKSRKISKGITGLLSALVPPEAMAGAVTYADKKKDRGRGRPHGTYKKRYLPDGRIVQVPTHIYRKMLSEYKAKRRLAEAQRQAKVQEQYEAEQIAMQQRATYEQPDAFLEGEDMELEAKLADARQQALYQQQVQAMRKQQLAQQRVGFATKAGQMFGGAGVGLFRRQPLPEPTQQGRQQVGEPYSARQVPGIIRPRINEHMFGPFHPQFIVTGGKSQMFKKIPNLLSQGNEFNRPEDSVLELGGVRRKW